MSLPDLLRVLALQDYNTRVVIVGVSLLGLAAGIVGSFLLLRKRSLLGDALSHATLPGIAIAFLVMEAIGGDGKFMPGLLAGAAVSGGLGVLCILGITRSTRIKEDAALGIVLSVFFGLGIALLGIVQRSGAGNAAGLQAFIYGKTASMLLSDAQLIAFSAAVLALLSFLFFKELTILCFDAAYARTQGWPATWIDLGLMAAVVAITVIGLQAVGLILMVALLVIPAAAARFWTHALWKMLAIAAGLGAVSGYLGATVSALLPRMPAGAVIVLVAGVFFGLSLLFGGANGLIVRWRTHARLAARIRRQHLLRALFEADEAQGAGAVPFEHLWQARSWSMGEAMKEIVRAANEGLVELSADSKSMHIRLTPAGETAARRVVRNHRLWELFLIAHAGIAPSHVDRDADEVEHVLDPDMIAELEALLARQFPNLAQPSSPHRLSIAGDVP